MTNNLSKNIGDGQAIEPMQNTIPNFEHIKRYWDHQSLSYVAKILPGEYYVTIHDELIITTLGSCVSACIRDPDSGIGGMNHFMLPTRMSDCDNFTHPSVSVANRYGNHAMENLVTEILKKGGERKRLEIKIFGGGKILSQMTDIGKRNIAFIEEYIQTEGFNLIAQDVGDSYPRKVVYHPLSGKVRVKKLQTVTNNTIAKRETQYLEQIDNIPVAGDIELFK